MLPIFGFALGAGFGGLTKPADIISRKKYIQSCYKMLLEFSQNQVTYLIMHLVG